MKVAALYVESGGVYFDDPRFDPWDAARDARLYNGPYPVIAHPPCSRWCRLAGLVEARWGHKKGEDNGCFAAALNAVRTYGGVLEHPAYSDAWQAHGLNKPPTGGGWVNADFNGGWTCYIEQRSYGHAARKATWLLAYRTELPILRWGRTPDSSGMALVSWCANNTKNGDYRKRISKARAAATPTPFRELLYQMAASAC